MLQSVNPQDRISIGRLLEFLLPTTTWHRSLWGTGLILGMNELHEACSASRAGILSDGSVRRICSSLMRQAGKDPALSDQEKTVLRMHIKEAPKADSPDHHGIAEMATLFGRDYLKRWARVISLKPSYPVEGFSRSVASHLLDSGFSATHIRSFMKARLGPDTPPITLVDLCEDLHTEMTSSPLRAFQVLLAFSKAPSLAGGIPEDWLQAPAVSTWLSDRGFATTDIRPSVGMVLTVMSRDTGGAADAARAESDRFAARALVATGAPLMRLPYLWVEGADGPVPQTGDSRGVRVKALHRENLIFSSTKNKNVDAAIELLAHLDGSSPTAAIAGGWGAIEGLLADPGDRATAAENLSALVTCSFPRAELTALSYAAQREQPEVKAMLAACASNRERSRIMAALVQTGKLKPMNRTADMAAVVRVRKLLDRPSVELMEIKDAIAESFHRLYRQRNLILHGGRLDSVSLTTSLRTVAKLAGAGMDRITHGQYVQGLRPLELVARANLAISLINQQSALSCVDLLEPI